MLLRVLGQTLVFLSALLVLGAIAACDWLPQRLGGKRSGLMPPSHVAREPIQRHLAARIEWHRLTQLDAYDRSAGRRSPAWDDAAREALLASARSRSNDPERTGNEAEGACGASVRAIQAGCDDPLVLYIHGRMCTEINRIGPDEAGRSYLESARRMQPSHYHALWKSYASLRASESSTGLGAAEPADSAARLYLEQAFDLVDDVARDRSVPVEHLVDLCDVLLDHWTALGGDRATGFARLYRSVETQRDPSDPLLPLLRARYLIDSAWDSRGADHAVTAEGRRLFQDRLAEAEMWLGKALALDPSQPMLPLLMMDIELGQGLGRGRMEAWFEFGRRLDPEEIRMYRAKLKYLTPRWHGTEEALVEFGRECFATQNWRVRVPLLLVEVHDDLSEYGTSSDYYGDSRACVDMKGVYSSHLRLNPAAVKDRSHYAVLSFRCRDWQEAHRQFEILGDEIRMGDFSSLAEYEQMRREAAEKAGARVARP